MTELEEVHAEIDKLNHEKAIWKQAQEDGNTLAPQELKRLNGQLGALYSRRDLLEGRDGTITARPRRLQMRAYVPVLSTKTPAQISSDARAALRDSIPQEFVDWCGKRGWGKRKVLPSWEDLTVRGEFERSPAGEALQRRLEEERKVKQEADEKARQERVQSYFKAQAAS